MNSKFKGGGNMYLEQGLPQAVRDKQFSPWTISLTSRMWRCGLSMWLSQAQLQCQAAPCP